MSTLITSAAAVAAANGDTTIAADLDLTSHGGHTAVWLGSANGHADVVHALIAAAADVHIVDNEGVSALAIASRWGHNAEIVAELLAAAGRVVDDSAADAMAASVEEDEMTTDAASEISRLKSQLSEARSAAAIGTAELTAEPVGVRADELRRYTQDQALEIGRLTRELGEARSRADVETVRHADEEEWKRKEAEAAAVWPRDG